METLRIPLRVVFYEEDGDWVAHCLEFDLVGVAPDKQAAMKLLSEAVCIQIAESQKSQNLKSLFRPADSEVFHKFAAGKDIAKGELAITWSAKKPPSSSKATKKPSQKIVVEKPVSREWRPKPMPRSRRQRVIA